jgi:uncharacterized protein YceK
MFRLRVVFLFTALLLPGLGGCGTLLFFVSPVRGPALRDPPLGIVYSGTAADLYYVVHGPARLRLLCLFDVPFSLLFDTALLPLTLPVQVAYALTRPPEESSEGSKPEKTVPGEVSGN